MNKVLRSAIPVIILMIAASCSTKKNTVVTRSYHNITSHYNIYFNGYDAFNTGVRKMESGFKDDYNSQLPLFPYSSKDAVRISLSDMDKTVKKCSKVIGMHSIKAKPKVKKGNRSAREKEFFRKNEYVKWVDDAFLLMGKAYFYKRDFSPAIETLEYVITQFPDGGLADEASLWVARARLELKQYAESQQILDRLQGDPKLNEKLKPQLQAAYANWFLQQNDLASAIPLLEQSAENYPSRYERLRIGYVLGQLYEKDKDSANAIRWYSWVNEMKPTYEMAFNARINRARLYQGGEQGASGIRKELMKMLRDEKNIDYLDQVYYALAELDMKEGKETSGVNYYKKSVWSNTTNASQKAISYLALAKYYYSKDDYVPAGAYYDSCSQSLPETYPDYKKTTDFAQNVKLLADNIGMVIREDSLQRIAKMPAAERDKIIADLVAVEVKKENDAKEAEEQERMNVQSGRANGMNSMNNRSAYGTSRLSASSSSVSAGSDLSAGSTNWYFYNQSSMSYGSIEFIKFWGRRKLEDNWRRSNKKIITDAGDLSSEGETGDLSTPAVAAKSKALKPTQPDFYLNDLPLNDTLMRESNNRMAQALLNTGKIFKDELKRPNEAVQYFDQLNKRFPEDERLLFSYYNLYQIYTDLKNEEHKKVYKDLIISKYPDSRSAKIISNPDYLKELDEARAASLQFYETTYQKFKDKAYASVIEDCSKADTAFKVNPIRDKFGLLGVMAFAKQNPADTAGLVKSINDLVFKYPQSEVAAPAKNLLNYIQKGPSSVIGKGSRKMQIGQVGAKEEKIDLKYVAEDAATHFYVVIVSGTTVDMGKLKFKISNFNVEKYNNDFFEVSSTLFDENLQIITVKNFTNKLAGMDYYHAIIDDGKVFEGLKDTDYRHFIISKDNYTRLYKSKNVFDYNQFFNSNYLNE